MEILENYRDNEQLRNEFFLFTKKVFPSIGFDEWYRRGFWKVEYVPYSIVEDGRIASNVSMSRMTILVDGVPVRGAQVGTVGTLPEYRGRGYSRILMEHVLGKYESETDFIFLFANETVLDFYPKFGFEAREEVNFVSKSDIPRSAYAARRLDIGSESDFAIIARLVEGRRDLTRLFGARSYGFITLWHVLNIFPRHLLYLPESDIIIIASEAQGCLHVWDVIYGEPFEIFSVLLRIIERNDITSIMYHFPPDVLNFDYDETEVDTDSGLFVRGSFGLKGRQFKFPVTAQT